MDMQRPRKHELPGQVQEFDPPRNAEAKEKQLSGGWEWARLRREFWHSKTRAKRLAGIRKRADSRTCFVIAPGLPPFLS
jgi:hypothetical protein